MDFIVYAGSETSLNYQEHLGVTGSIVTTLLEPFLNKGHSLFVDSFYCSPTLFEYLHQYRTGACGTVNKSRVGLPIFEKIQESREQIFYHTENLLASQWTDKRDVTMLSTLHEPIMVPTGKVHFATKQPKIKPLCVVREIIGKYGSQVRSSIGRPPSESPLRLTARHFPSRIESTETQLNPRRKCYLCANTVRRARSRRDTSYEYIECDVGLCLMDCFKDYHTLQAF